MNMNHRDTEFTEALHRVLLCALRASVVK